MTVTQRNIKGLHRKEWQLMSSSPSASGAGACVVHDRSHASAYALFVRDATTHYLYNHLEDGWSQVVSGSLAGSFGAGACGARSRWSRTLTATGGTTTTITTGTVLGKPVVGSVVRFLSGSNVGLQRTVTGVQSNPGGTVTVTMASTVTSNVASGDTFVFDTGRFWVMSAGTTATGIMKSFDLATMAWDTSATNTGIPGTWGTDGKLVATPSWVSYASGTATAGASTTLTNSTKTWTTNQWANYQVRIKAGTGIGQVRTIASNTGTVLTVSSAWTTNPDATSQYSIEANDDFLYLLGNNAVTMYRYSISGGTWTTLSPGTARAAAPGAGMSGSFMMQSGDATWANESAILDGRYIYSFRGGASSALDRYDIAANSWSVITYIGAAETFTTGSGYESDDSGKIVIRKDATNRFFTYDVVTNTFGGLNLNSYPDATAVVGDKIWIWDLPDNPAIKWVYSLQNSGQGLHRMMLV